MRTWEWCHSSSVVRYNPCMDDIREFARRYTQAWCSQDPASVAAFYSPNGSLSINGGDPAVGRGAITEFARGFMTTFPDLQVLMDDVVARSDRAEYHWTLIGAGRRVRISGYEVWTIGSDGLIAESRGSFDSAEYQRQLGLV
jgi:nuclear transport factor 2 (NTF2) superfamily protein